MKVESKAMLLEWEEGSDGNTPIIKYKIQYKISGMLTLPNIVAPLPLKDPFSSLTKIFK